MPDRWIGLRVGEGAVFVGWAKWSETTCARADEFLDGEACRSRRVWAPEGVRPLAAP
jgi:hypothetical protein